MSLQKSKLKKEKATKSDKRESDGERIRSAALQTMKRKEPAKEGDDVDESPIDKKKRRVYAVDKDMDMTSFAYILEQSNYLKAQELQLSRDRYELDKAEREARFQLEQRAREAELAERTTRLDLEKREREQQLHLLQNIVGVMAKNMTQ